MPTLLKLLALAAPVAAASLHNSLVTTRYSIRTPKLRSRVRVVLLADLHATLHGKNQRRLIRRIEDEYPDLILMAGDMLDETRSFHPLGALLRGIVGLAPVFYVTGNHEYRIINLSHFLMKMQRLGVTVLNDSHRAVQINDNELLIAGLRDAAVSTRRFGYRQRDVLEKSFSHLTDDSPYKILLAHRPEAFPQYARYPFDLVVSGHAHGGQIRFPGFGRGLYSHGVFFPPYTEGLHELYGSRLVVSRGLSRFSFLPRIFNPPEVVSVTLLPEARFEE